MAIYFLLTDTLSNPLSGSVVSLTPYSPPYISASFLTYGGPIYTTADQNGSASFNGNIFPGVYKVTFKNSTNPNVIYMNYPSNIFYINVPPNNITSSLNGLYLLTGSLST